MTDLLAVPVMHPSPHSRGMAGGPAQARTKQLAATSAAVRIDVCHGLPRPLVQVSGELDIAAVPLLVAMLDHARRRHPPAHGGPQQRTTADMPVDVDLSRVSFADSHGLAPILNGTATVVSASAGVRRVLELLQEIQPLRRADRKPHPATPSTPRGSVAPRPHWRRDQA